MNKGIHRDWMIALILIVIIICGTLIWINHNSWTIRFEMDDNTLEAIESIDWQSINQKEYDVCKINKTSNSCLNFRMYGRDFETDEEFWDYIRDNDILEGKNES